MRKVFKIEDYEEVRKAIKPLKFKSMAEYKRWARQNGTPLNPEYWIKRGINFEAEYFLSKGYSFKTYQELKDGIAEYNDNNPDDIIDTSRKYRNWARENNAPSDPKAAYNLEKFDMKDLLDVNLMSLEDFIEFCESNNIKSASEFRNHPDKNSWPRKVPRVKLPKGFKWSMLSTFDGKIIGKDNWAPKSEAVKWYRNQFLSQGVSRYRNIDKSSIPTDIPNDPSSVYDDWSWSDVTGNESYIVSSRTTRKEIADIIRKYINVLDHLTVLDVLVILDKISKDKIGKYIKDNKIDDMIEDIVRKEEPGERSKSLEEIADKIENSTEFKDTVNTDEEEETLEVASKDDLEENQEQDPNVKVNEDEEEDKPFDYVLDLPKVNEDYEGDLKSQIKAIQKTVKNLSDDVDIDLKNFLVNRALNKMLYLEALKS